jgi:hypothetical protein
LAAVLVLITTLPARAQSPAAAFNSTAAAVAGGGTTWDDEGKIGKGLLVGGRVDRRLFGNTFVEVSLDHLHHERSGRFSAEGNTTLVTGAVVQRFGRGAVQPYALGGLTVARHRGTYGFLPDKVSLAESTDTGFLYGGGLAVRAGPRFEVGPEVRFFFLGSDSDSSPAIGYWIGARLGVRF